MVNLLANGGFELPVVPPNTFAVIAPASWTTAGSGEIWASPFVAGLPNMLPYPEGNQIFELDGASQFLSQNFVTPAAAGVIQWSYWTHQRNGLNGVSLQLGDSTLPLASDTVVDTVPAPGFDHWILRTGGWNKPAGVTSVRFRMNLLGPFQAVGTLVDAFSADFVASVPIPCDCCPVSLCGRAATNPLPTFFGELTGANGRVPGPGADEFTFPNFMGSGVNVVVGTVGETLAPGSQGAQIDVLGVGVSPPVSVPVSVTFSQPVYLRRFGMTDLDFGDEKAHTFQPQVGGVYGQKAFSACNACLGASPAANPLGCVADSVNNGTGGVTFPAPLTSALNFVIGRCSAGAGSFLTELGFDLVAPSPVFACRQGTVLHWYDENGVEVPAADVVPCDTVVAATPVPLAVNNLFLNGFFFGDDPSGLGENLCNIVPAPTSMVGFSPVGAGPGCLNPVNGVNSLTWAGPISSVAMDYGANPEPVGGSGACLIQLSGTGIPVITWPAHGILTAAGQSWQSNFFNGGHIAVITATTTPLAGTGVSFDGGVNVRVNGNLNIAMPNYGFKIDFF